MSQTTISLPITRTTQKAAEKAAVSYGFTSLTEAIKAFIQNLATGKTHVEPKEKVITLSRKNEKRYAKIVEDIKVGKNIYRPENKEDFFRWLRESKSYLQQTSINTTKSALLHTKTSLPGSINDMIYLK